MTATSDQLRDIGQQRSLFHEAGERDALMRVIDEIPANTRVSVNTVRDQLDTLEVPDSMRGALFNAAIRAGLIIPATVTLPDWTTVDIREKSTGASAHSATVRVYQRTTERWNQQ